MESNWYSLRNKIRANTSGKFLSVIFSLTIKVRPSLRRLLASNLRFEFSRFQNVKLTYNEKNDTLIYI